MTMTPQQARDIAAARSIPLDRDFHALDSDAVAAIIAAADDRGYRAPRNANGSRARYFHAMLVRTAARDGVPVWEHAVWEGHKLQNRGGLPLWSGKGAPPAVGSIVDLAGRGNMTVRVERYRVDSGWLMIWGTRSDGKRGDLAGAEIRWPKEGRQ